MKSLLNNKKTLVVVFIISAIYLGVIKMSSPTTPLIPATTPTEDTATKAMVNENLAAINLANNELDQISFLNDSTEIYANGKISGYWNTKSLTERGINKDGHRVIYSLYNPISNVFYAVSNTGSLYKLDEKKTQQWELLNNKVPFSHYTKGYKRIYPLTGVITPQNKFRLILQGTIGNSMYYSDTEGRTWRSASGLDGSGVLPYETFSVKKGNGKRIVAFGGQSNNTFKGYKIHFSDDYGLNYKPSSFNKVWAFAKTEVRFAHALNSDYIFALVRNTSNIVSLYQLKPNGSDFEFVKEFTSPITKITNFKASFSENKHHFYVRENNKLYYANDGNYKWTLNNTDVRTSTEDRVYVASINPDQSSNLYYGFTDLYVSNDSGKSTIKINHGLDEFHCWDIENLQFFKKLDGSSIAFVGSHYGCFFSENITQKGSWRTLSNGCPVVMPYDAIYSEKYNVGYTANQDKGTMQYFDGDSNSNHLETANVNPGDCFRVTLSNDETSIWYTKLGGTLFVDEFNSDLLQARRRQKQHGFSTGFWGTNVVISPNLNENAVYLTGDKNLKKFTDQNDIIASDHPVTFENITRGFAYSKINRNKWYVSDGAGDFHYSTDGGTTFTKSEYTGNKPGAIQSKNRSQHQILADVINENKVYYAGVSNTFLISTDGGKSFKNHNKGLSVPGIYGLDMSVDGKYIFAACGIAGPWLYSVEDDYWFKMDGDGVDSKASYYTVQYLKTRNSVRFTSYGGGISDFNINQNLSEWIRVESEDTKTFNLDRNWLPYSYTDGTKVHYAEAVGSEAIVNFKGDQIRLYGMNRADLGMFDIFIDDVFIKSIDTYGPQLIQNKLLFTSPILSEGSHQLKIVTNGKKNTSSRGVEIVIDGVEIKERETKISGYQKNRNLSPFAKVTSSSNFNEKYTATNATDNSLFDGRGRLEWASRTSIDPKPKLTLNWDKNIIIDKIILYDRASPKTNILSSTLTFSNGTSLAVSTLPFWGNAKVIDLDNLVTKNVTFSVETLQGSNVGLKEIMVIGEFEEDTKPNIAPLATITVSSEKLSTSSSNLNDEINDNLWLSDNETNPIVTLTWESEVDIYSAQIYGANNNSLIKGGKLCFDNGSYANVQPIKQKGSNNISTKLNFNGITTKSISFEITESEGQNIGLSEIRILGDAKDNPTLNLNNTVNISNDKLSKATVYPNPTNDYVTIKTANKQKSLAKLYDLKGSLLTQFDFSENQTISLKRYKSSGLVILTIQTGNQKSSHKIIIN